MDIMNKIIEEYTETGDDFVFKTIYPYCTEVVERKVSKAEIKRLLNKGLQFDDLSKKVNELQEINNRITKRNNELRGKVLRLINNNEELKEQLERQVHNNIKMEYVLNKFKEALQEADNE